MQEVFEIFIYNVSVEKDSRLDFYKAGTLVKSYYVVRATVDE